MRRIKKRQSILLIILFGFLATVSLTDMVLAAGSVVNSQHNMNVVSNPDVQQRVCAFCHTPHHALTDANADYNPLWSHTFTSQTFSEYESPTLQGADGGSIDVLAGPSRLCMSCHDGAIAVDQHYQFDGTDLRTGDSWGQIAVGAGGDLTNDHPIGFDYAVVGGTEDDTGWGNWGNGADPEIRGLATPLLADPSRTIEDLMLPVGAQRIMTCASCHDVHDTYSVDNYFLIGEQQGSQICLTCHNK